ncbi:MAG: gamma-glutamyl-gamma-aminobutyrate hydrolase family protein [Leptolyngbyaceae cyanobacterium SM1_3_5]|nr:gamma-glutamyl-gamma-aminobutyrate hydrolase family protein [Leptolyngbyaceae cyanobacterium SM1_3_5]
MGRPVIGITTYSRSEANDFTLPATYVDAIQAAGGTAVLLPPQPNPEPLIEVLDGLIFAGGGDIDPARYGSLPNETVYLVDADRDEFELKLAALILKSQLPTLGICRGMQILTVASGGDLIVHVPDAYGGRIQHRLDHPRRPTPHLVQASPNSRLSNLLEAIEFEIVSWHHQAIKTVPPDWKPVAQAADGLVEAIEHQQHPWLIAVQWHPELSPDDPVQQQLFRSFVRACRSS